MMVHSAEAKIDATIREHALIAHGNTVVVAVSGGIDSVVLLHYLAQREDLALTLVVAHLNHCLRNHESDADELFVRDLSRRYGIRCEVRRTDVAAWAREKKLSKEEAGRECRYAFFKELAQAVAADAVAVAHHLDDQAETVLLRLIRGSGTTGLRGMSPRSADGRYIRPLLGITRAEIAAYAQQSVLDFRIDSSNDDRAYLRNRIRHELMPLLTGCNPAISRRLAETAAIMAADEKIISGTVAQRMKGVARQRDDRVVLDIPAVASDMTGMRLRLYRSCIERLQGDLRRISSRHLRAIDLLLLLGPPNGTRHLPAGLKVMRRYDELVFSRQQEPLDDTEFEISIASVGCHELPDGRVISVVSVSRNDTAASGRMEIIADLDQVPFPWIVRSFRPGDRMVPAGMTGHKKIKDLFIDEKIPRHLRSAVPLFFSGSSLFWAAGLRRGGIGTGKKPSDRSIRVQILEIERDTDILG